MLLEHVTAIRSLPSGILEALAKTLTFINKEKNLIFEINCLFSNIIYNFFFKYYNKSLNNN